MTKWSASGLQDNYLRCVFGYDLRVSLFAERDGKVNYPATMDTEVWPTIYDEVPDEYQHGLNLFSKEKYLDLFRNEHTKFSNSVVVGFDIPLERWKLLGGIFGIDFIDIDVIKSNPMWHLIGYDVIDPVAATSGLHTPWNNEYKQEINNSKWFVHQNRYGLITSEREAIEASVFFDEVFKSSSGQSPFTPCGVWLRSM